MFKHHDFSVGEVLQIVVKKVKSPSKFWAQIVSNRENKYTSLKKEIQDYYNDFTFSKSRVTDLSEGMRCVIKGSDRVWHRAVIDMVLICPQRLIVNCYLVDEVIFNYIVPAHSVYEAPAWVWEEPIQSSCFALHGIAPIKLKPDYMRDKMNKVESSNLNKWDPASVKCFEDLCTAHPHFNAEIVDIDEKNVLWIKLFFPSDKNRATMNKLMVSTDMAMFKCGASTDENMNYFDKEESKNKASSDGSYQSRVTEFRDHVAQCIKEKNAPRDEMISLYEDVNRWLKETFSVNGMSENKDKDSKRKPLEKVSSRENEALDKGIKNLDISISWVNPAIDDIAPKYSARHKNTSPLDTPKSGSSWDCFSNKVHDDICFAACKSTTGAMLRSTGTQTEKKKTIFLAPSESTVLYKNASFQIDMDEIQELNNSRMVPSLETVGFQFPDGECSDDNVLENGKNLSRQESDKSIKKANKFYSKAPCTILADEDDENSKLLDMMNEKEKLNRTHADQMKEENEKDELNLHAVVSSVTPDNLHSGSIILIRGHKPPNPISLFCKAPFPRNVIDVLELRDIIAIATRNGGKTMAYVPALASVLLRTKEHISKDSKQPMVVVVTTNWEDIRNIHCLFEELLSDRDDLNVISVHGGPASEDSKAAVIASGCSVLISTAPSLVRICHARYMNFTQLRHLVLDDINVLVEKFTEEVREIMRIRFKDLASFVARCDSKKPCQLICLGSQWTEGVNSYFNRFLKRNPLLLISHPLEAAVYGNVKHSVIACSEVQRMECVLEILKNSDVAKAGGLAMFVHTPTEADQLHELVSSLGFYCEKAYTMSATDLLQPCHYITAHSNMHQGELDEFKFHYEEGSKPILIATDNIISELDIYCIRTVLHYTFPMNQHDLGIRLSTMQSFFLPKDLKSDVVAESIFFLTSSSAKYAGDLVTFLNRVGQKIPQSLTDLANSEAKSQEIRKGKIPLCLYLKAFGTCRDEAICPHRHHISILDQPNNSDRYAKIPTFGHVRLQVTNVVNATHYWARLDALRTTEGNKSKIRKYDAVHAQITIDLTMYFKLHSEAASQLTETDPKLKKIYALSKTYERVSVLPVPKSGIKVEGEAEDWSCVVQKAQGYSTLTHWKTPGGATKVCVRLVDIGSVRIVRRDELIRIPSKIAKIPFQAIEVRVCGVRPVDKDISWHSQVNEFIHENLYQKTIEGNIVAVMGRTLWLHPVEVRSKLPLTGCIVSEFSVAHELVKAHYADKNLEQVAILKQVSSMFEMEAKNEGSISSSCQTTDKSTTLRRLTDPDVSREDNLTILTDVRKDRESQPESLQPCSTIHDSSTESIFSVKSQSTHDCRGSNTKNFISTGTNCCAKRAVESVYENAEAGLARKTEHNTQLNEIKDDHDDDLVSIPAPHSVKLETLPAPIVQEASPKIDIDRTSKSSFHLLGTLTDLFATPNLKEGQKLKILHEIHVKCVGCPYDVTENDLVGLNNVLLLCNTTQEKRLVLATLLSLALDQVPVLFFVELGKIIEIGCKVDLSELVSEPMIKSLTEIAFLLAKALTDSLRKVTDHKLNVASMVSYLKFFLSGCNTSNNEDLKEQAAVVLGKMLEYESSIKKNVTDETKKKPDPNFKEKPKVTDVLNYDRFNHIDTDCESVQHPYTPLVCKFESSYETDSVQSSSTIDRSCRMLENY